MKKIRWWLEVEYMDKYEGEFEVEDDVSEEKIEELAKDVASNCIDWGWEVKTNE